MSDLRYDALEGAYAALEERCQLAEREARRMYDQVTELQERGTELLLRAREAESELAAQIKRNEDLAALLAKYTP